MLQYAIIIRIVQYSIGLENESPYMAHIERIVNGLISTNTPEFKVELAPGKWKKGTNDALEKKINDFIGFVPGLWLRKMQNCYVIIQTKGYDSQMLFYA